MINNALFKKYRTNEFIQFISNTLMIIKEHGADKLKIKACNSLRFIMTSVYDRKGWEGK